MTLAPVATGTVTPSLFGIGTVEARRADLGKQNFVSSSVVDAKLQLRQSADAQLAAAESVHVSARQDVTRLEAEREGARQQRGNIRLDAPVAAQYQTATITPEAM